MKYFYILDYLIFLDCCLFYLNLSYYPFMKNKYVIPQIKQVILRNFIIILIIIDDYSMIKIEIDFRLF